MRYSFRSFNTVLNSDASQFSKDFYQTTEIWGGFNINNKIQILSFIPYNFDYSNTDDGIKKSNGFGDITFIGNYNLLNSKSLNKDTLTVGQQLWIGGGLKLPTGHYSVDAAEIVSSANSQAGTGSLDFLLTTSYSLVIDNWGLTSNLNYKINQAASDFRFGNRFTATAFTFYAFHLKNTSLSPNIGLLYEYLNPNELAGAKIASTGGQALLGAVGVEARFNKITVGLNAQLPLEANISDGQTKINLRGMAHLTYAF